MSRIFTIPAGRPFLTELARGLNHRYRGDLPDCLILLPSRRACLALRDAFLEVCADEAMLLPRMQPVGEAGSQDLPLDAETAEIEPAIDPLRRQLLLAQLVHAQRRATGKSVTDEHAIRLAADLAAFLDEMQTEEVPLQRLYDLASGEMAVHWQEILEFLRILGENWPSVLSQEGRIDPSERRRRLLDRTLALWRQKPPVHPVIAAGITGTIPAVARLLRSIALQPKGCVVLPGLDHSLDEESWRAIACSPTHPQFGLKNLLNILDCGRLDVGVWLDSLNSSPRERLIGDVMRPAGTSDSWQTLPDPPDEALSGLSLAEMRDFAAEAELIALKMREALDEPHRNVALVTSDRTLGRRVAAELKRFDIDADDSAGIPLDQTPPGSFLILCARAIIEGLPPVQLLALLKHPLAHGGLEISDFRRQVRALERTVLRGVRRSGGFPALTAAVAEQAKSKYWPAALDSGQLLEWLDGLDRASQALQGLAGAERQTFGSLIDAHLAFAEWLASDTQGNSSNLWMKEAGQQASLFMARLMDATGDLDPIAVTAYPALLAVLMGNNPVYPLTDRHPRALILGQLESRLLHADTVLIGGLNEGVWPRPPAASPWLNRAMRSQLGLPPGEQQIGIAAHDFTQMAAMGEVLLSRSRKDAGGAPTAPSRWLVRLDAVLRAKGLKQRIELSKDWHHWVQMRVEPQEVRPVDRPEPCPPVQARPREIWVTDVEWLMRNPYQFYARRILGLSELEPLDAEPGASERGQIVHAALEDFVRAFPSDLPPDAMNRVVLIGQKHFERYAANPQVHAIWWPKFLQIAEWFVAQERVRRMLYRKVLAERTGDAELEGLSGRFKLKARADRIELGSDFFSIIDYKTGTVPKPSEVATGLKPQLPLTAVIAEAGGFEGVRGMNAAQLLYWGLRGGTEPAADSNPLGKYDLQKVIVEAREGIARLVDFFSDPKTTYPAVPRPEIAGFRSQFDHLARHREWQGNLAVRGDGG